MDLAALLAGTGSLEQAYINQDPFYQAGKGIAQIQFGAPRNNTEAFLMPFLQNTAAGGLAGYGRQNAMQTGYQDISKMLSGMSYKPTSTIAGVDESGAATQVPLQYGLESAPEGFSLKTGLQDLLMANTQRQAQIEAAAKKQEITDKLAIESSPLALDALTKQELAKASGKRQGEGVGDLKADIQNASQIEKSLNFIDQKYDEAKKLTGGASGFSSITGIPTAKGNALTGLGDSVVLQVDAVLGKEMNSDVRDRVLSLAPKFYDDAKTIEQKKTALKELVASLSKATPALDALAQKAAPKAPVLTQETYNQLRQQGLSQAQIKAKYGL